MEWEENQKRKCSERPPQGWEGTSYAGYRAYYPGVKTEVS